jgi:hypothetical protein
MLSERRQARRCRSSARGGIMSGAMCEAKGALARGNDGIDATTRSGGPLPDATTLQTSNVVHALPPPGHRPCRFLPRPPHLIERLRRNVTFLVVSQIVV